MQWSVPRPQTRSTAWMPTTARSGNSSASDAERDAVGRVVERRHQHRVVGDVEVRVARRQPLAVEDDRRRHRQRDHLAAAGRPGRSCRRRRSQVLAQAARSSRRRGSSSTTVTTVRGVDEARQVVDVAVGVVAGDAAAEPEHLARRRGSRAKHRSSRSRDRGRGCAPASGSSRHSSVVSSVPCAVDVDAAAFEHDAPARAPLGCQLRQAEQLRRRAPGDGVVALPVGVLRPAVEAPVGQRDLAVAALAHEDRARSRASRRGRSGRGRSRRAPRSTPARRRARRARRFAALRRATRMRTRSPRRRWRTISA